MHEKIYKRMTMLRKGGANGVFRRIFLGTGEKSGVISRILLYAMLVILSYIFLYPFLYMLIIQTPNLGWRESNPLRRQQI